MQVQGPLALCLLAVLLGQQVAAQHTVLDDVYGRLLRQVKGLTLTVFGRTSEDPKWLQSIRNNQKTQQSSKKLRSLESLCPDSTIPKRSAQPPTSVHRLRPGDIDIVGAVGDSLTAGNAIYSSQTYQSVVENRGRTATIGGQGTWRDQLTLPNILKEFNPKLYGYSLRDGLSADRATKFNVGESGAMSRDMPFMARVLVKRMRHDRHVNMADHWKFVTYFIGANDFCADMCFYDDPEKVLVWHERDLLESLRYLRDNVPRLIVNLILAPNTLLYADLSDLPRKCLLLRPFACPCLIGLGKTKSQLDYYESIIKRWMALDEKIASREEFNTDTFTLNALPILNLKKFPEYKNGKKIVQLLAEDCFHFSAYGQAIFANAIWNNLIGGPEDVTIFEFDLLGNISCPTVERPYLKTRVNVRDDFQL